MVSKCCSSPEGPNFTSEQPNALNNQSNYEYETVVNYLFTQILRMSRVFPKIRLKIPTIFT